MGIKKILIAIWKEFIYGGHVLALGAVSITFASAILLSIKITWDFLMIVYLGIYSVYLYNRYYELDKDSLTNFQSVNYFKKYARFSPLIILFCIFIIFLIQIYFQPSSSILISALMLFLGIFYSIYLKKLTEKIFAFKNFFIPLMWASLIFFLAIYYSFSINYGLLLIFILIFLRIFIAATSSDIRDIESDKKENLKTLPVILGKESTFIFLNVLNVLTIFPILIGFYFKLLPNLSLTLLFTSVYAFYYINVAKKPTTDITNFNKKVIYPENIFWIFYISLGILINKLL